VEEPPGAEGQGSYERHAVFQRERLVAGLHRVAGCSEALDKDNDAYVQQRQRLRRAALEKQVAAGTSSADLANPRSRPGRCYTYRRA